MKILVDVLKRIAIALENLVEIGRYRNEMLENNLKADAQFKDAYIENMNKATDKLIENIGE